MEEIVEQKSSLPKSFTTVTPRSKYLALGLFIILPFVGFYLGMQYQKSTQQFDVPTDMQDGISRENQTSPTIEPTSTTKQDSRTYYEKLEDHKCNVDTAHLSFIIKSS